MRVLQWLWSLIFSVQIYLMMAILAVVFLIPMFLHRDGARAACKAYTTWVLWTARWMLGLRYEVRGPIPQGEVLIAAKHQSFLDIIILYHILPRSKFIMKRELLFTPIIGQYAYRLGCVPVNRGKGAQAIKKMEADVRADRSDPGQLVIYPQGTRVAPGATVRYKIGTAVLYQAMGGPCVPVAVNTGLFWPRRGVLRRSGTAVVRFLDPIPAGMDQTAFMAKLEDTIEAASNALMAEAGFDGR